MTTNIYGKANYDNNSGQLPQLTFFKLRSRDPKVLSLQARIAPPIKDLAEKGTWAVYVKTHFGYRIKVTKKDGTQVEIPQTFVCPEQRDRTGNITSDCPECNAISLARSKMDTAKKRLEAEGKTAEQVTAGLRSYSSWLKNHALDKKWHMIAKSQDGKWGYLQISHSLKKRLGEVISEMVTKSGGKLDPLGPERGVWFHFTRNDTQKFNEIDDQVKPLMEETEPGSGTYRY